MSSEMEIRVIENNKDRIARAVSMAVANGDKEMANALYPRFFNDMKNATIFFIGVSKFESSYEIKRKKIIKELSDFIGHDVKPYIDGECKVGKRVIVEDESKEFLEFYKKYARYYARYGIEYETLKKIYFADEIEQLDQKISKIQKYQWAREFKEYRIQKKEMKKLPIMGKEFDELRNKFKVTTIDELFLLGIEIDSFFVDVSNKTERQKNILERNKERFRQRIGASHDYVLDEKSAEKIKEKINRVYNFNLYRQLLDNSNLGEFFRTNNYEYTGENLSAITNSLLTVLNASAICFHHDFGDGKLKHCWFGKFLMNESAYCQNMVVVHELIHSLEPNNYSKGSFCKDYWYLNEAMTEYFATRAQKYLGANVMKNHGNEDTPYTCWYSKMLPLVEVLENSFYWNYFLDAKFNGNLVGLINIMGKRNLSMINQIFIDCINTESIDYEERKKLVKKLTELLDNMDKKKATSL